MRPATLFLATSALVLILPLAGCGSEQAGDSADTTTTTTPSAAAQSSLTIEVKKSPDAAPTSWRLECDPPGGTHPTADQACAALGKAEKPFAPPPKDQMCTKIYGGPQVATVEGTWRGEPVNARFTRGDGCEISRWDALSVVLGGAAG